MSTATPSPVFVPVRVVDRRIPRELEGSPIEIVLCTGRIVRVSEAVDCDVLLRIVGALESNAPC